MRKMAMMLMCLFAVPAFADAAWYVTATGNIQEGGTVTPAGRQTYDDAVASADFTVAASAPGYKLTGVKVDGKTVQPAEAGGNVYRVLKPAAAGGERKLAATFAPQYFKITAKAGAGGTIKAVPVVSLAKLRGGTSATLAITPKPGYGITAVTVNGAADEAARTAGSKTLTIDRDYTVTATFAKSLANAGADKVVLSGKSIQLDGSRSSIGAGASIVWSATGPGAATFGSPNASKTTFTAAAAGDYTVTLTITAGDVVSTDIVKVTVQSEAEVASQTCTTCHSSRNPAVVAGYGASKHAEATGAPSCKTCHAPTGGAHFTDRAPVTACASCHTGSGSATPFAHTAAQATCSACHTIDPHSLSRNPVSGSIADAHIGGIPTPAAGSDSARGQYVSYNATCADCHAGSNQAILQSWSASAHGDINAVAWKHYAWAGADRAACRRCHTTTGFIDSVTGSSSSFAVGVPNQVLACNACHSDVASGVVRDGGAYTATFSNGATIAYPADGASSLCIRCHGGRESGDSIKNKNSANNFANESFINSHYLAAAGTVFNAIGYHYGSQTYNTVGYHKNIDPAGKGACVTCHMTSADSHSLDAVTHDAEGKMTAITTTACASCHADMTTAKLQEEEEAFEAALNELKDALAAKGIFFQNAHPYFYQADLKTPFKNWDSVAPGKGKDVMGAAFNYNLLAHEEGAYVHNKQYSLQLIADSIEFLTQGEVTRTHANGASALLNATGHIAWVGEPSANVCSSCHSASPHFGGIANPGTAQSDPALQNATNGPSKTQWVTQGLTCSDCHGSNPAPNKEWAESGHGHVSADDMNAFNHYDWSARTNDGSRSNGNCGRCHTAYGFIKLVGQATGLERLQPVKGQPNAVLACVACHSDISSGALRLDGTPAGMAAPLSEGYKGLYTGTGATTTEIQFANYKKSNICIPCHAGRTTENIVKTYYNPAFSNRTTGTTGFYQHAANIVQTFSGVGAYEYVAGNYSNLPKTHATQVGMGNDSDKGPCITCHNKHSLKVENFNVCASCHGNGFGSADVQRAEANFNAGVKVLTSLVQSKLGPLFVVPGTPIATERAAVRFGRFGKAPGVAADVATASKAAGAWYNWHILTNADPKAFVHNPAYARQILIDTIDFLDDGINNNSAAATISASTAVTATEKSQALANASAFGCLGCHSGVVEPGIEKAPHYNTNGELVDGQSFTKAQFVVPGATCKDCHSYGHDAAAPPKTVLKQYEASAHGETSGMAWTDYDFKTRATCNACHTTQGFMKAASTGWSDTTAMANTGTEKQVLACNACHTSNAWKSYSSATGALSSSIRPTGAAGYSAGMGGFGAAAKATVQFSNQGESNVCFPCHASRENGDSLKAGNYNFTNKSFVNPHYLGSAAVWQGKGGFKWYSSSVRYGENRPTHGVLTSDLVSVGHSFNSRMTPQQQQKGSCVACHLGFGNDHSFNAFSAVKFGFMDSTTKAQGTPVTGCLGCHSNTNNGYDRYYRLSNPSSGFYALERALDFLAWQFSQVGIYFNNGKNPYFFTDAASTLTVTNWTTQLTGKDNGNGTGLETMGAAMNLKLLSGDKGAAAHNAQFSRAVIADSLVYLQHGSVGDRSSTAPINNISFTAYSTAITPVGGGAPIDGKPASISNLKSFLTSGGKRR